MLIRRAIWGLCWCNFYPSRNYNRQAGPDRAPSAARHFDATSRHMQKQPQEHQMSHLLRRNKPRSTKCCTCHVLAVSTGSNLCACHAKAAPGAPIPALATRKQVQEHQMLRLPRDSSRAPGVQVRASKLAPATSRESKCCACHAKAAEKKCVRDELCEAGVVRDERCER